jgi:hypothetical protein
VLYEAIEALIKAGLPVALLSFLLMYWSLHRGHLKETGSMKALQEELKQLSKDKNEECNQTGDPIHNKWMKFGGGFYGVVAILTLLVIEWSDVKQFGIAGFQEILADLNIGTLINLVMNLMIEQFKTFIAAISWPVYWMGEIESGNIWIWFLAAYAGYSGGTHLARYQAQVRKEEINNA